MPTRAELADRRARWRAQVLARVAEGASLVAACAGPDAPSVQTVFKWRAADPGFDADLKRAQHLGEWAQRYRFDDARARAFLARLAAGEGIRVLERDPGTPPRATLLYWRRTQIWFGEEVLRLIQAHRKEQVRQHLWREPRAFDARAAERVLLWAGRGHDWRKLSAVEAGLPGSRVVRAWRRANREFDDALRVNIRMGRFARLRARRMAALAPLTAGIVDGGTLRNLGGTGGLPTAATLYRWAKLDPAFRDKVADACDWRERALLEARLDMIEAGREAGASAADLRRRVAPLSRRIAAQKRRPGMGPHAPVRPGGAGRP
jgi:hypothetical protein